MCNSQGQLNQKSDWRSVCFCSILGHRIPDVPVPMFNIYPATKFALNGLAQTFRQELRFHGLKIKFTVSEGIFLDIFGMVTAIIMVLK